MNSAKDGIQLLASILSKQGDIDVLANDLLEAIRRGFPMAELRVLLESEDAELVKAGAWIQSELGAFGRPLLSFSPGLLRHPLKYVRFFAIDSVLGCAGDNDSELVVQVLNLVHDAEPSVRWKVVDFLVRIPSGELCAAEVLLLRTEPDSDVTQALRHFVHHDSGREAEAMLLSKDAAHRRFGLALAIKQKNLEALELATTSSDDEVRDLARETLARRS